MIPREAWAAEIKGGPERKFYATVVLQAALDAAAIGSGNAKYFREWNKTDEWVLSHHSRSVRHFINTKDFAWYCSLMDIDHYAVSALVFDLLEGKGIQEFAAQVKEASAAIDRRIYGVNYGINKHVPKQTQECTKCGAVGDAEGMFGTRYRRGKLEKQSWCKPCRAGRNGQEERKQRASKEA